MLRCEGVNWMRLSQWRAVTNTVRVP